MRLPVIGLSKLEVIAALAAVETVLDRVGPGLQQDDLEKYQLLCQARDKLKGLLASQVSLTA